MGAEVVICIFLTLSDMQAVLNLNRYCDISSEEIELNQLLILLILLVEPVINTPLFENFRSVSNGKVVLDAKHFPSQLNFFNTVNPAFSRGAYVCKSCNAKTASISSKSE